MYTKSELQTVLRDVKTVSEQLYGTMLNRIILYGSYARGDNTDDSELEHQRGYRQYSYRLSPS